MEIRRLGGKSNTYSQSYPCFKPDRCEKSRERERESSFYLPHSTLLPCLERREKIKISDEECTPSLISKEQQKKTVERGEGKGFYTQ